MHFFLLQKQQQPYRIYKKKIYIYIYLYLYNWTKAMLSLSQCLEHPYNLWLLYPDIYAYSENDHMKM